MQGIWIGTDRPKSKKAVKEALTGQLSSYVRLEATSMFGNEYDGLVRGAPDGTYYFVGPDPYTSRKFYGQIIVRDGQATVK